jgi:hypothetical protein
VAWSRACETELHGWEAQGRAGPSLATCTGRAVGRARGTIGRWLTGSVGWTVRSR